MTCHFLKTVVRHKLLRHLLWPLVLATTTASSLMASPAPGDSEELSNVTYHSTVSEVRLVFFATDDHNHTVEGLKPDDFAVVDNEKVIRNFRSFTRSGEIKLDVIVLFDSSESVVPHFKQEITEVLHLISQWPSNPEDNISVVSFSGLEAHPVCAGDCRALTAESLASSPRGGATPLFDALDTAASLLSRRRQPDVWPVIILFSDGLDTISKSSFPDAVEKVVASGAQIYAVDMGNPARPSHGSAILQRLASASGGRCIRSNEGAVRIFTDIIDDLHSARVVTYALPPSRSDFHSVRILPTHNLNLQFRSRGGYYYHAATLH
jgi:VWFA-related protein